MTFLSLSPLGLLLLPLVTAVGVAVSGRWPNLRDGVTLLGSAALTVAVWSLWSRNLTLPPLQWGHGAWAFVLHAEPLGLLFALVAASLWSVTSVYAFGYMRHLHEDHQTRFFAFFALSMMAVMGVAMAGNLLTLFVFYEALTLATYPLVVHSGTPDALRSGRVYLGVLLATSLCFLMPAVVWISLLCDGSSFRPGGILAGKLSSAELSLLVVLVYFGLGKAALMPFHRWLPAAMVAPTPVSAFLHAVAVVKAGVFAVLKVTLLLFGPELLRGNDGAQLVFIVAAASIVLASLQALRQDHLKRRLAYSTVSQLSYVTLSSLLLVPVSLTAAAAHLVAHACAKITLFFTAGAFHAAAHKDYVSELNGIGRHMPWTVAAFTVAALSMIGLPPLVGFWSKLWILQGAWQVGGLNGGLALAALGLSSLLNAAYFLPVIYRAVFGQPTADSHGTDAPWSLRGPLLLTAAATVALFFAPQVLLALLPPRP